MYLQVLTPQNQGSFWDDLLYYSLMGLTVWGLLRTLVIFYYQSMRARSLKEYALEYIIYTLVIITCFALNYSSLNAAAEKHLQQALSAAVAADEQFLAEYFNRYGFISEKQSSEIALSLNNKQGQAILMDLQQENRMFNMFYFSTISYLTIGYGDFLPIGLFARFLVLVEVFLGHISTAVVLVVGIAKLIKGS